jgi:hypothetical protein
MKIRCACGHEFETPDHDEAINFAVDPVVGPLGPGTVQDTVLVSRAYDCPHCLEARYSVVAVELAQLKTEERLELERFLLRLGRREESTDTP